MSYILRTVRPADIQNWIKTNAVGSLKGTASDSWRAYLTAQGATGKTISEMEMSFLSAQSGKTLKEKWANFLNAETGKSGHEKARAKYK